MTARTLSPVVDPATQNIAPGAVYPGAVDHHHPPVVFPNGFEAHIDEVITHYPVSKRSASLPLLHLWQETFGYISPEGIEWIAAKLELQPINILELVTFYPMFRQHRLARFRSRSAARFPALSAAPTNSMTISAASARSEARTRTDSR